MPEAIDIHQDVDEQYARLLRIGTRLGLLDPALLIWMFRQYQLGMRAAKFAPADDFRAAPDDAVRDPDEWVGAPNWVCRRAFRSGPNVLAILKGLPWMPMSSTCEVLTWTFGHYRAVVTKNQYRGWTTHADAVAYWYDAHCNLVAHCQLPFADWNIISGGMLALTVTTTSGILRKVSPMPDMPIYTLQFV